MCPGQIEHILATEVRLPRVFAESSRGDGRTLSSKANLGMSIERPLVEISYLEEHEVSWTAELVPTSDAMIEIETCLLGDTWGVVLSKSANQVFA